MEYSEPYRLSAEDAAFVRLVESGEIDPFGHREHLRLAFVSVRASVTADEAVTRCRRGIRAVATARGAADRYHATITSAWLALVRNAAGCLPEASFDELLARRPELADMRELERHYSPERLASDEARARALAPDRAPLPG